MSSVLVPESLGRACRDSELDVGDLDLDVLLPVALALLVAGLVLVLLDDDLRALGGAEDLDGHGGLVEAGGGDLVTVDDHDDGKGQRVAHAGGGAVDLDDVADGNLLLLAACAHDCVHGDSLSSGLLLMISLGGPLDVLDDRSGDQTGGGAGDGA